MFWPASWSVNVLTRLICTHFLFHLSRRENTGSPVSLVLWNAVRQPWMIHLVRVGSSSAAAESAIDWAARQVMDWIYPVSGGAGAPTRAQELKGALPTYACVQFPCAHNTHKHRWRPLRKTCVTLCRHLDSQDQRQWCIVSRRVDRGWGGDKTRRR